MVVSFRFESFGISFLSSAIKDVIWAIIVLFSFAYTIRVSKKEVDLPLLVLFVYLLYYCFHLYSYVPFSDAINGIRYNVPNIVLVVLLLNLARNDRFVYDVNLFAKLIIILGALQALIGLVEFFYADIIGVIYGVDKEQMNHVTLAAGFRLISLFRNPINYGIFLNFSLASLLYFRLKGKVGLLIFIVIYLLILFNIFFTLSRMALVSSTLLTLLFFIYRLRKQPIKYAFFFSILMFFAFSMVVYFYHMILALDLKVIERVAGIANIETYTENIRVLHWIDAIKHMDNVFYQLLGLGAGVSIPGDSRGFNIENSYVTIFVELGYLGLTLFLVVLLNFFYRLCYVRDIDCQFYIMSLMLVFLVMSTTNDMIRNYPFSFWFWMTFYFCYCQSQCRDGVRRRNDIYSHP
ncbi:O-antigen ligase family protein [Vibrio sp. 10N.286.51.E5]|uniref:O-antigen ligase family protein n=1 Tax=Vibrio sp. 10N.286.51.E5 TaxID=3229709 RepID=UPI00355124F0